MRLPQFIKRIAWRRWLKRLAVVFALGVALVAVLAWTGVLEEWARATIVRRIEQMSGGRAELKAFRFETLALRATLEDFTLHGREPQGAPPFFRAESLVVDVRVDSLLRRKISLDEVRVQKPAVYVAFNSAGQSNVPVPQTPSSEPGQPFSQRLFDLAIKQLRVAQGTLLFNRQQVPITVDGGEFALALDYQTPRASTAGAFRGELTWLQVKLALRNYLPFASDVKAKFTLAPDSASLDEFSIKVLQSRLVARASLASFAKSDATVEFDGDVALANLRTVLRLPNIPDGQVRFDGKGSVANGALALAGTYAASEVDLPYAWFHARGLEAQGSYRATSKTLTSPDFSARALGGVVTGPVHLEFSGVKFHTDLRANGMSLAGALAAVDHARFPIAALHWDGSMDVQGITTWEKDFQRLETQGTALWSPPAELRAGTIPATARLEFHFRRERERVEIARSQISTPQSRIEFSGALASVGSVLEAKLETRDLTDWNDFIRALTGDAAEKYTPVAGRAEFAGRITGPLGGPTFAGRVHGANAAYGQMQWDQVEGDVTYSPTALRFARARAQRGRSSARLDYAMALTDWSFRPENPWSLEAELERAPSDDLQAFFRTAYPVGAQVSGQFRGGGTRAAPELTALVDLAEVETMGLRFDRARGQLKWDAAEVRVNNAELRKGTGRITGNVRYGLHDKLIAFDAAGAVVPIEQLEPLQTAQVPLGGQVSFQLRGSGPAAAPQVEGSLRVVDLRAGDEVLGSFESKVRADGRQLRLELTSAMAEGALGGSVDVTLAGQYPMRGDLTLHGIDLDPFMVSAFRLPHASFTGHSRVDGRFTLSGDLLQPTDIAVTADISRLTFGYESVLLENDGPVKLAYHAQEVRIEQAHLKGADSDFQITGFAQFNGGRRLGLQLSGLMNLQLLGGFVPDLEARGSARVNTSFEGTTASPRITGRVRIEDAAAQLGDFPAGLSRIRGDLVFDRSRLLLESVSAEAGGGRLTLGGAVTYGEGPLRYDLTIGAARVRVRYPEGMSWLSSGALRIAGTQRGAVLSGRIALERLLLSEGFDFGSMLASSQGGAPGAGGTTSPFLRNLQFDIEVVSAPDARMEWAAARFDCEAQLRVRGTWEHPILLGHIHLLSGEMTFRGNRYTLTRGDVNFSNPFRIDPVLNLEGATTIRQYEVTLNFTGPASRLTLAYRSDPPLPANDVVALLALGRAGEETELRTGASRSTESGASALLGEAVSSQIGGRIERLFGVSRFRIDPFLAGTGTEQNASARITIEQQVARDLVITYITNVSSTQQQVIQVEYAVNRDVSIIALRDQNGTFGLDVKFKKRFK